MSMLTIGRITCGFALAALSAVLLTLAFAPHDAWPLVWVGFVPMAVAQRRVFPSRWSGFAPAVGVGGFIAGCFGGVFPDSAAWYMKALPLLVGGAVFLAMRGQRTRLARTGYALWPLQATTAWVAIELFRSWVPALGTWGFLGYAMYRQPWFLQPVAAFGTFGLDALIVLANYAVALVVLAALDRWRRPEDAAPDALALALSWGGGVLVGLAVWTGASLGMRSGEGPTVRVAALQPGRRPWQVGSTPESRDRGMLAILGDQTRRASAEGARLVVWPEAALRADPQLAYPGELSTLARAAGAYLVVGYLVETPRGSRNEALMVAPDGAFLGTYGKSHPVTFLGGTSVSRGPYTAYATPLGSVGTIICADMDFTDTPRELARSGAKVLAVPSADWPAIARTHYVLAVFRALETGAAVVKSEFSRDSAIADASGNLVASAVTKQESAAVLVGDVRLRDGTPLAARLGDWVGWLCAAGLVAEWLFRRLRSGPST